MMTALLCQRLTRPIVALRRHCVTQSAFDEELIAAGAFHTITLPYTKFVSTARNLNWHKLTDATHVDAIRRNIARRKGVGDIDRLHALYSRLGTNTLNNIEAVRLAWQIPNDTSTSTPDDKDEVVAVVGTFYLIRAMVAECSCSQNHRSNQTLHARQFSARLPSSDNKVHLTSSTPVVTGRTLSLVYTMHVCLVEQFLSGTAARLARALLQCAIDFVLQHDADFEFVDAPEIVDRIVAEGSSIVIEPSKRISRRLRRRHEQIDGVQSRREQMSLRHG